MTIRQILTDLDKEAVKYQFIEWCKQQDLAPLDWVSGDGKSLKSTLSNSSESSQDFCGPPMRCYCQFLCSKDWSNLSDNRFQK